MDYIEAGCEEAKVLYEGVQIGIKGNNLLMNRSFFKFHLPEDFIRTLDRERYYRVTHYLRYLRWSVSKKINWDLFDKKLVDNILYGGSTISDEELILNEP